MFAAVLTCTEQFGPQLLAPEETHGQPRGERDEAERQQNDADVLPAEQVSVARHARPRQHVRVLLARERLHGQGDGRAVTCRHHACFSGLCCRTGTANSALVVNYAQSTSRDPPAAGVCVCASA